MECEKISYRWLEEGGVAVLAANAVWDGTDGAHTAGENVFTPYIVKTIRRPFPAVFVFLFLADMLHALAQQGAHMIVREGIEHRLAIAAGLDQPGIAQDAQLV